MFFTSIAGQFVVPLLEERMALIVGCLCVIAGVGLTALALGIESLAALDGCSQLDLVGVLQHAVVWIDNDTTWLAVRFHAEGRIRADNFNALGFSFPIRIDLELHRHAEEVEILRNLSHHAKSLVVAQAVNCVFGLEFGSTSGIEPLGEEPRELVPIVLLGKSAEIVQRGRLARVF